MSVLVIIPTYNEAKSIAETLAELLAVVKDIDVLVIDDNSPDGTAAIVEQLAAEDSRISLMLREKKQGLGPAYLAGFGYAIARGYTRVVEMDADGSHRPADLLALLQAKAGMVIGSRWITGGAISNWSLGRIWISRIGNRYAAMMLATGIRDMTSGFRVIDVEFLKSLDFSKVSSQGYSFQIELAYLARQHSTVVEVPIRFIERREGESKMTFRIVLEALFRVSWWGITRRF